MGDLNFHLSKHHSHTCAWEIISTMVSFSFLPLVSKHMHTTTDIAICIDNIFTNDVSNICNLQTMILNYSIPGHSPVLHSLCPLEIRHTNTYYSGYHISRRNLANFEFRDGILLFKAHMLFKPSNEFFTHFKSIFNSNCPKKKLKK